VSGLRELVGVVSGSIAVRAGGGDGRNPVFVRACELLSIGLGPMKSGDDAVHSVRQVLQMPNGDEYLAGLLCERAAAAPQLDAEAAEVARALRSVPLQQTGQGNVVAGGGASGNISAGRDVRQKTRSTRIGRLQVGGGGLVAGAVVLFALGAGAGIGGDRAIQAVASHGLVEQATGTWSCDGGEPDGSRRSLRVVVGDKVWGLTETTRDGYVQSEAGTWDFSGGRLEIKSGGHAFVFTQLPQELSGDGMSDIKLSAQFETSGTSDPVESSASYTDGVLTVRWKAYEFRCTKTGG
jgi:hypothetical protein